MLYLMDNGCFSTVPNPDPEMVRKAEAEFDARQAKARAEAKAKDEALYRRMKEACDRLCG